MDSFKPHEDETKQVIEASIFVMKKNLESIAFNFSQKIGGINERGVCN